MSTLRDTIFARLRALKPRADAHDLATSAALIAASGAYIHDGQRLVPVGTAAQMAYARSESPELAAAVAREHVASVTSGNPLDRVEARLQAMGTSLDEQFGAGPAPAALRDAERARAALTSNDPIVRTRARLHLMGIRDDTIGGFDDDPEAA